MGDSVSEATTASEIRMEDLTSVSNELPDKTQMAIVPDVANKRCLEVFNASDVTVTIEYSLGAIQKNRVLSKKNGKK
jgi:hypothetical protein